MRGTLHLVASEDLGWILGLFGERSFAAGARRRAQLGLDDATIERAVALVRDLLASHGPATRPEVAAALAAAGIPHEGQATIHVLAAAAHLGHACYGPSRDGRESFVYLPDWLRLERPPSRDTASAELARRYVAAHWPADGGDFAYWSGLPAAEARAAWSAVLPPPSSPPESHTDTLRLLPAFDPYLLGWRDRSFAVPSALAKEVHPGGGTIRATVLRDGEVVRTWRVGEPVDGAEAELADVRRFLG
jgi:hypothetical protein